MAPSNTSTGRSRLDPFWDVPLCSLSKNRLFMDRLCILTNVRLFKGDQNNPRL
ncbi:hypothetical protein [Cyanobacterium sp. HL-69]|uniref:hypothetical protein n=1 Tax=Cyanobacterium sp. HL-69 TaxID=2054282 RepID=UPI00406BAD99